jgi:hypothetical protein
MHPAARNGERDAVDDKRVTESLRNVPRLDGSWRLGDVCRSQIRAVAAAGAGAATGDNRAVAPGNVTGAVNGKEPSVAVAVAVSAHRSVIRRATLDPGLRLASVFPRSLLQRREDTIRLEPAAPKTGREARG